MSTCYRLPVTTFPDLSWVKVLNLTVNQIQDLLFFNVNKVNTICQLNVSISLTANKIILVALNMENFTDNCGIRAVSHIYFNNYVPKQDKAFYLTIIESYINKVFEVSLLLASDGIDGATQFNITNFGTNWKELQEPQTDQRWYNKRMLHDMKVFAKNLYRHADTLAPIDWNFLARA